MVLLITSIENKDIKQLLSSCSYVICIIRFVVADIIDLQKKPYIKPWYKWAKKETSKTGSQILILIDFY